MLLYSAEKDPPAPSVVVRSSWGLLSCCTTKNDKNTIAAPTQYIGLEYWDCRTICPIRESGMVILSPTVTISGVVRSIA